MGDGVTVCIPVGPSVANRRWLFDAVQSVQRQTLREPIELLLIDDMAGLPEPDLLAWNVRVWHAPWRLGVAHAFNFGVMLAQHERVFMLGSDDWLEPTCLVQCLQTYNALLCPEAAYLYVNVRYSDSRPDQFVPCNAAMVTKELWRQTGGFPVESASGAPDAALISILMRHRPETLYHVPGPPLYNYRVHDDTDTAQRGPWQGVILETRNLLTELWKPPA